MHLTLTKKYILSYLLFGIGCFFLISTVTSNLIMKQVVVEKHLLFTKRGSTCPTSMWEIILNSRMTGKI